MKWHNIIKNVAYRRITNCTNVAELMNIRKCLYKLDVNGKIIISKI
jgi:hypothetical protein